MPILPQYFAIKSLEKILPKLPVGQQKLLKELISLLDTDGGVNALKLRDALFPVTSSENSANTMLRRLLDNINDAATALGLDFVAMTTADKKAGDKRRVWFEGAAEVAARPHTSDLNRIAPAQREDAQRGMPLVRPVILMTFNVFETKAVLERFTLKDCPPKEEFKEGRTYTRLGIHGETEVIHVESRQGNHESQGTAEAAIQFFHPSAIILVGIAFGIHPLKQHIGDVLVSEYLRDYELVRLNGDGTRIARGKRPEAALPLIERIRHMDHTQGESPLWPRICLGVIMCGDKLVDNRTFREDLLKLEPEAVGGEMEGCGVATACSRHRVDWMVLKGISDWADGGVHTTSKADNQKLAASNAAQVAKALLETPGLFPSITQATPELVPAQPANNAPTACPAPKAGVMGLRDRNSICDEQYDGNASGKAARLDDSTEEKLAEGDSDIAQGVPVLHYLQEWIEDPKAPPLFAMLGEYGMGKTVTSQQLAKILDAAHQEDPTKPLPLYFDLRHLTGLRERGVPTLDAALQECMQRGWLDEGTAARNEYTVDNIHSWIAQGAVVIFDGLDEVLVKLTEADGQVFTNNLLKLLADAGARAKSEGRPLRLKVLITCRTQYFPSLQAQNNHFTQSERGEYAAEQYRAMLLLPWRAEQIRRYLASILPDMKIEQVLEMIASVHNLQELAQRPYALKLVGEFIPDIERDRSAGRPVYGVTLYRKMAEKWLLRDAGKNHIRPEHKLKLVAHLAAYLWHSGRSALPVGELHDWLHTWLGSDAALRQRYANIHPDQLEEDLRTATFLTREDSDEGSTFRFTHTSLLEFFLSDYLLQAIRDNQAERWAMPIPSQETLNFLGQSIAEADTKSLLKSLQAWRHPYRTRTSELLLAYALHARRRGLPLPILHGIDLREAQLRDWRIEGAENALLDLGPANFSKADLRDARLQYLRLNSANFAEARLGGANLLNCEAKATRFTGAELTATIFRRCALAGSDWQHAHGYRTQWLLCEPDGPMQQAGLTQRLMSRIPACVPHLGKDLTWLTGHVRAVNACAWSPDGRRLASAGQDGTLRLWDTNSGETLQTLSGHAGWVNACAWSPDSLRLASAGRDGTLRLWDADSGAALHTLSGHASGVNVCAWSPDSRHLASAGDDGTLRLWDAGSGAALLTLRGHCDWIRGCAWSPDGRRLASAGNDGTLQLWDADSGATLLTLSGHAGWVNACAWSPDGRRLASAGNDCTLRLWDADNGAALLTLSDHSREVNACAWSPDGQHLASAGADGTLRLWDTDSGEALLILTGHTDEVRACAWSPDGRQLASAGADRTLRLWNANSGETLHILIRGHASWIGTACAWSPDGRRLASAGNNGTLRLWNADSGEALQTLTGHIGWVTACAWSPDGQRLAAAGSDRTLRLWNASSGEALHTLSGHTDWVRDCVWSPDGQRLASVGDDGTLRLWSANNGEALHTLRGHVRWVWACAWSPDGRRLASAGMDGTLRLWDADSGKALYTLPSGDPPKKWVRDCAWSSDGRKLVSTGSDGILQLWNADNGEALHTIGGHPGWATVCAWSPDGRRLVSAGDDGTLRVWDAHSGEALHTLTGHAGEVGACAWSPDSRRLISTGDDGTLRLWDADSGVALRIHALCTDFTSRAGRAVWSPSDNQIIEIVGDAWRFLAWQGVGVEGWVTREPLEIYGPVSAPV